MTSVRTFFVRASLVCALLLPAFFVATAMATKSGLLDWRTGFGVLTLMVGPLLVAACLIVATAALALTAIVRPRRGWRAALLALAAPAIGAGWLLDMRAQAARAPPIHDISTDLLDPPGFSADVQAERAMVAGSNSLDLMRKRVPALGGRFDDQAGRLVRELQEESYPDIRPIPVGVPAARARWRRASGRGGALIGRSTGWTRAPGSSRRGSRASGTASPTMSWSASPPPIPAQ